MSTLGVQSIWDHIICFKASEQFNGLSFVQNSVKLEKVTEIMIDGLKKVHTLFLKGNNPNQYHKYILLSYQNYQKAANNPNCPKLLVSDTESLEGKINEPPKGSFCMNLNEETVLLKSKFMFESLSVIIQVTLGSIVLLIEDNLRTPIFATQISYKVSEALIFEKYLFLIDNKAQIHIYKFEKGELNETDTDKMDEELPPQQAPNPKIYISQEKKCEDLGILTSDYTAIAKFKISDKEKC